MISRIGTANPLKDHVTVSNLGLSAKSATSGGVGYRRFYCYGLRVAVQQPMSLVPPAEPSSNWTKLASGIMRYRNTHNCVQEERAQACLLSPVSWSYDHYVIGQTGG